jgi:hypothetical protein
MFQTHLRALFGILFRHKYFIQILSSTSFICFFVQKNSQISIELLRYFSQENVWKQNTIQRLAYPGLYVTYNRVTLRAAILQQSQKQKPTSP